MEPLIIPIVGMAIPIIIVPITLGVKHARFLREVTHAERMRAMELGRALPEDERWSPARIAGAIGVGVPLGSMAFAWLATLGRHGDGEEIWMSACMMGLCGLICGTTLAWRHITTRNQAATSYPVDTKPEYDPDAYDVVGRRG